MQTVADARAWANEELKRAQKGSPLLSADLLLAFVLGWDRVRVLSHVEESVPEEAWRRFRDLVLRHARGSPLQYLTGQQEFYGLVFAVGPGVLIPRPETEILVERTIGLIRSRTLPATRFLDLGTGSGCIAISVTHEVSFAYGCGMDVSEPALRIARLNAIRHGVAERVLLIRSNLLDCFPRTPAFDFIFCNPPYVAFKDYDSLPPEVRDHEPHLALFGGPSGVDFYRKMIPEVPSRLFPEGYLLLEIGAGQAEMVRQLVEAEGLFIETVLGDLQGIPRCLVARKPRRSY